MQYPGRRSVDEFHPIDWSSNIRIAKHGGETVTFAIRMAVGAVASLYLRGQTFLRPLRVIRSMAGDNLRVETGMGSV
jgi:hypothetical protein